ncbi:MAG: FAD:protein FMN transferase [Pseudomonadota bacterium]|nr:FAD:protein FMN transferase [Pseudomonadota bacterium]
MKRSVRPPLAVWLLGGLLLTGCVGQPTTRTAGLYVFGTLVEVTLIGANEAAVQATLDRVDALFQAMHRDWHPWKPGRLTTLNGQLSSGAWSLVDPDLLGLIEVSSTVARASGHRFNPAIGRLVALWGFHGDELPVGEAPDASLIADLVSANPRMTDLEFRDGAVRSRNPALQLDFGGIAKGYALDLARQRLRSDEVSGALLNAGGDLCVLGRGPQGPWRVGIRDPFDKSSVRVVIALPQDLCAMTSGNYERYRQGEGIRWGHLLNPESGYPVTQVASVTVIHPDGAWADAAATALAVAGGQWRDVAAVMGLDRVMVVSEGGATEMTAGFRALLIEPR